MELLAPAGSFEALQAALYAGADAIYLGGNLFNARQNAANFDLDELAEAVKLAHDYNAKIYLTVNTLINESEINQMKVYLADLAKTNVDAFIIQDLAVAKIAKEIAPQIERHASTQMTVHNSGQIEYLIENGYTRVVLARELPIETVKEYSEKYKDIGFEVFAHGALCYSYSGQCLLSSMIGGRSGNRGDCAGPCRLPYKLFRDGEELPIDGDYLLSTKDLCTIEHVEEFKNANISAIKIEGRMKRPEYVYSVVSEYRKAIDLGEINEASINHLKSAFNRGFTKGLIFNEKSENFMGIDRPDNRGELVARIEKKDGKQKLVAITKLNKGDLLAYRQKGVTKTHRLEYDILKSFGFTLPQMDLTDDLEVTRVKNIKGSRVISDDMRRPVAKYKLDVDIMLIEGQHIKIEAKDNVDNNVYLESEYILPKAHTSAATEWYVKKQMSKLGGTLWELREINVKIVGQPAAPSKVLNQLRRDLVEQLLNSQRAKFSPKLVNSPKITSSDSLKERTNRITKLAVSAETIEEAKAALEAGADLIYFGSEKEVSYFSQDILEAKKLLGEKFVWRLPRITEDNSLEAYLSMYEKIEPKRVYADNLGQIYKLKDKSVNITSGSGLFVMNSLAAKKLQSIGVDEITLSVELNEGQIRDLLNNFDGSVNMVVGEKTLLMIHQSCILAGVNKCTGDSCRVADYYLKDRLDYIFDLGFDDKCRSYLYNSQDLALIDHLSEIINMNVDTITLDLSGRGEVIVKELTDIYSKALVETKRLGKINVSEYKDRIQAVVGNQLTRGHWHRGV